MSGRGVLVQRCFGEEIPQFHAGTWRDLVVSQGFPLLVSVAFRIASPRFLSAVVFWRVGFLSVRRRSIRIKLPAEDVRDRMDC